MRIFAKYAIACSPITGIPIQCHKWLKAFNFFQQMHLSYQVCYWKKIGRLITEKKCSLKVFPPQFLPDIRQIPRHFEACRITSIREQKTPKTNIVQEHQVILGQLRKKFWTIWFFFQLLSCLEKNYNLDNSTHGILAEFWYVIPSAAG